MSSYSELHDKKHALLRSQSLLAEMQQKTYTQISYISTLAHQCHKDNQDNSPQDGSFPLESASPKSKSNSREARPLALNESPFSRQSIGELTEDEKSTQWTKSFAHLSSRPWQKKRSSKSSLLETGHVLEPVVAHVMTIHLLLYHHLATTSYYLFNMGYLDTPENRAAMNAQIDALERDLQTSQTRYIKTQVLLGRQIFWASTGAYAAYEGDAYLASRSMQQVTDMLDARCGRTPEQ
ncbi:hypothetical protein BDZ89DRAFT_1177656, partial [Hymenopellis radicata]